MASFILISPPTSPGLESNNDLHVAPVSTLTCVSLRGIISPNKKKFFIFSGYCCHAFFLLDEKEFHGFVIIVVIEKMIRTFLGKCDTKFIIPGIWWYVLCLKTFCFVYYTSIISGTNKFEILVIGICLVENVIQEDIYIYYCVKLGLFYIIWVTCFQNGNGRYIPQLNIFR